jgi:hypothetical protein
VKGKTQRSKENGRSINTWVLILLSNNYIVKKQQAKILIIAAYKLQKGRQLGANKRIFFSSKYDSLKSIKMTSPIMDKHFHLNKQFQNIVAGILSFQKLFDVDVLGFQIEPCCRYFGLF